MRLGVAQFTPVFRDVDANVRRIEQIIRSTDVDVLVFPELATSGYFFHTTEEARPYALAVDSDEMNTIASAARETGRVVVCGFAERSASPPSKHSASAPLKHSASAPPTTIASGLLFNSAITVGPEIPTTVYRKTHLFYRERDVFEPGDTGFAVVNLKHLDCNLGTMICYDWRFPESSRTLALMGADVIAAPSNLITHVWRMAMPVRALENKVYLAVANRTGTEMNNDESVTFNGDSVIYKYSGEVMVSADAHNDCVLVADINPAATRTKTINSFNDILADRRPHLYK